MREHTHTHKNASKNAAKAEMLLSMGNPNYTFPGSPSSTFITLFF